MARRPAFRSKLPRRKWRRQSSGWKSTSSESPRREFAPAFESLKGKAQGVYIAITPFTTVNQDGINRLAVDARLPTVHGLPEFVRSGGLMSYGANFLDNFRRR
jgi:hypothetical protein